MTYSKCSGFLLIAHLMALLHISSYDGQIYWPHLSKQVNIRYQVWKLDPIHVAQQLSFCVCVYVRVCMHARVVWCGIIYLSPALIQYTVCVHDSLSLCTV